LLLLEFSAWEVLTCFLMEIILYHSSSKKAIFPKLFFGKRKLPVGKIKKVLQISSYNLIAAALLILVVSLGPAVSQEISYRFQRAFAFLSQDPNSDGQKSNGLAENEQQGIAKEAAQYGVDADFSLVIPKIKAAAKVIPNVNPASKEEYKNALKEGVAHAAGSKLPGEKGVVYLFAHSTNSPANISRYNAVFYLLKELKKGDQVIVFFANQKYVYQVWERFITEPNDTQWLTDNQSQELLVLQTCWPPGTTQKRLIITAQPIKILSGGRNEY